MKYIIAIVFLMMISIGASAKEVNSKVLGRFDLSFIDEREALWQALHAMDVLQTIKGPASDSCHYERNAFTRQIIGKRPHPDKVIIWGVTYAVLHVAYTKWLNETKRLKPSVKTALRFLDFTSMGLTIATNYKQGIRITGENKHTDVKDPSVCIKTH